VLKVTTKLRLQQRSFDFSEIDLRLSVNTLKQALSITISNRPAKEKGQSERGPRSKHSDSSTWKPSQCDKFPISSGLSKGTFLPWNIRVLDIQVGGSLL